MKKYIKPSIEIVNVECESLLQTVSFGSDYSGGTVLSRKHDFVDDDEEDFED